MWQVVEQPELRGYTVEWAEPGYFILSRRNRLFETETLTPPFKPLAVFPARRWQALAARVRLAQRALRFTFYNVLRLPNDELFLTFGKSIGVYREGRYRPLEGLVRPCRVLRGACALHADGCVYWGEYVGNRERELAIHIYRYTPGQEWVEPVHTFAPGQIRHVHGIYSDPTDADALWCVSGDRPAECRIMSTRNAFESIEVFGQGDESWRCVSLQFHPDAVYYASDAEFDRNFIYRIDRGTGERSALTEIEGPVYYSLAVGRDLFFGVSAELCPSQQGCSAVLWHIDAEGHCTRVLSLEKDRYSRVYFLPGAFYFPRGPGLKGEFFFHGVALAGADHRTFQVKYNPAG